MKKLTFLTLVFVSLLAAWSAQPVHAASPAEESMARLLSQKSSPPDQGDLRNGRVSCGFFDVTWLPDGSGYLKLEMP